MYSNFVVSQIGLQNLSNPSSLWSDAKDKSSNGGVGGTSGGGGNNSTASSSSSTVWNMEAVMQAIMELAPSPISAKEVMLKLDHKGFFVSDRVSLNMLVAAIRKLSNSYTRPDQFPVACIYRKWQHTDEQVLLLNTILSNPDIFCFFDFPCNQVIVEMLKTVPELDNKEVCFKITFFLLIVYLFWSSLSLFFNYSRV